MSYATKEQYSMDEYARLHDYDYARTWLEMREAEGEMIYPRHWRTLSKELTIALAQQYYDFDFALEARKEGMLQ